ncbi:modification methylase HaeIII [Janthinobacterium sp. MP5059B]|uniref:DNA cytosine methyltransferase n=1 Tax=Janthinobacterium sp. MP5059B TaxID=1766683 RepID=UPI000893AE79|nr:DNA (cytosine-5-)-methyltransferase [Janthinobacterium sp. MP5059B]OEZ48011.1 modification methylase HaeIII [Janthinobacterium sp. MP5059B]
MRTFPDSDLPLNKIQQNEASTAKNLPFDVVSFFAGCGGLDLGFQGGFKYGKENFKKLPFKIVKAYDIEEACNTTYSLNIGNHFEVADLANADVKLMPKSDVLIGGFPCQEFSICGPKGGSDSKRGALFRAMSRYAKQHKPMLVIAENVAHILRINNGKDLETIYRSFSQAGYRHILWKVFAPDFGIPQARDRIIFVFVRKDIKIDPIQPKATHIGKHRSVEWAIGDLMTIDDESVANQSQYFKAGLAKSGNGQGDEISPRNAPGYTVRANAKSRVQFHYELKRRLTIRECARLQTFPDNFVFPHAATTNIRQIGNAVPPILGHVVANSIQEFLSRPELKKIRDEKEPGGKI